MKKLEVRSRTLELTLLLVDRVLSPQGFSGPNTEVFVLACIIFVIKFEGDFPIHYNDFLNFVCSNLDSSKSRLLQMEAEILDLLPIDFPFVSTFSECTNFIMSIDDLQTRCSLNLSAFHQIVLTRFIEFDGWTGIADLIVFPILLSTGSRIRCRRTFRKIVVVLKQACVPKARSWKGFEHFLSNIPNKETFPGYH